MDLISPSFSIKKRRGQLTSIFDESIPEYSQFWHPIKYSALQQQETIVYSGIILNKEIETEMWKQYIFKIQVDRIQKMSLIPNQPVEYCSLSGCILREFSYFDQLKIKLKQGFQLQIGKNLSHFICESDDDSKKIYQKLSRFCILEDFHKNYKIMTRLSIVDSMYGLNSHYCIKFSYSAHYLVKIIQKNMINEKLKQSLFKEIQNLRRINHQQIIRLLEVYEDEDQIYQVFDNHIGESLSVHMSEYYRMGQQLHTNLEEKILANIMYGLISAVAHMHSKGIFHRDIKFDNIIVPDTKRIPFTVLINLNYSDNLKLPLGNNGYTRWGSAGYVAPEIFETRYFDQKIDVFSLGVIFYMMIYGQMPFQGDDQEEILIQNNKCEIDFQAEQILLIILLRLFPQISIIYYNILQNNICITQYNNLNNRL